MSNEKIVDPGADVTEKTTKVSNAWSGKTDDELLDIMFERGIQPPVDTDGKLVRRVAVKKIAAWEEEAKPIQAHRKMRVVFHRSGRDSEAPYVFMSLNGVAYQAPYEVEVEVPEPVIRACIDDAVQREYAMKDFDPATGQARYEEKVVRAVPYTFMGFAN